MTTSFITLKETFIHSGIEYTVVANIDVAGQSAKWHIKEGEVIVIPPRDFPGDAESPHNRGKVLNWIENNNVEYLQGFFREVKRVIVGLKDFELPFSSVNFGGAKE